MTSLFLSNDKTDRADFEVAARKTAAVLKDFGVGEDMAIAVLLRNDTRIMEIVEACRLVGARYALLNWHAAAPEIAHILEDSGAKLLITHEDLLESLDVEGLGPTPVARIKTPNVVASSYAGGEREPIPARVHDLDALIEQAKPVENEPLRFRGMFAYTSGSTGRPKGIKRNTNPDAPDSYEVYAGLAQTMLGGTPGDKLMVAAPLYHSAPHALATFAIASGFMDLIILPKFDPVNFLEMLATHKVTHVYIVPTMMVRLLKLPDEVRNQYDLSSLRFAVSTGSPWPADVKTAMIDWLGPIFYESYGASELGFMTLISSEEAMRKPGSVGKILQGGSIKIIDDDGNELPPGEVGSIYVHLPLFGDFAYTNAEGAMVDQRIQGHATVGDVGYLDEEGYLFISDRKKDMIISGGANIFPAEIEAELIKMTEVADCAVFGAPDPEFGERIIAAVQLTDGNSLNLEDARAFLESRLAKFKLPKQLDVHDALPREDSGKIFKKRLRDPYWEGHKTKV